MCFSYSCTEKGGRYSGRKLATMEKLDKLGFDSVIVTKESPGNFKIDIMKTNSAISFYEGLKEV